MESSDIKKRIALQNLNRVSSAKSYAQRKLADTRGKLASGRLASYESADLLEAREKKLVREIEELEKARHEWKLET